MTNVIPCSIIIPVLNEERALPATLEALQPWRQAGHEVILVDGGSNDSSMSISRPLVDHSLQSECGRALQMNHGAAHAQNDWLLFLHADTLLPISAKASLQAVFDETRSVWGHFDIRLSGRSRLLAVIAWFMNKRSRLTGIATGDQAMFVRKTDFERLGGFPKIALMEDITLSSQLKCLAMPSCLADTVTSSGRRWEDNGIIRTVLKMWRLRFCYFLGAKPDSLAKAYRRETG